MFCVSSRAPIVIKLIGVTEHTVCQEVSSLTRSAIHDSRSFMAVPDDGRRVPRPVNTIVENNGRIGPNQYSVRERGRPSKNPDVEEPAFPADKSL